MADKQEIEINILPDGRVEYTVKGVKGPQCTSIADVFRTLGLVEHEENTGEYYEKGGDVGIYVQH